MWSILSSHHSQNSQTHLGEIAGYVTKHRYVFIVLAILFALIIMTSVFILQASVAGQKARHEAAAVAKGQAASVSATVTEEGVKEPAAVNAAPDNQVNTQSTQNNASISSSEGETKVQINNETVQLPSNGSVHRTIENDNGTTQIDVSVNSNSTGSSFNSSVNSTSVNAQSMNQSSQSSISINNSQ